MLDGESELRIPGLPRTVAGGKPPVEPHVRSSTVLVDHAIEAYLEMTHPEGDVRVVVGQYGVLPPRATDYRFSMTRAQGEPSRWRLRCEPVVARPTS
jgi:hypothetical protein